MARKTSVIQAKDQNGNEVPMTITTTVFHGLSRPATRGYGIAHLRRIMAVSDAVVIDQLCEEAAQRITELQKPTRRKW